MTPQVKPKTSYSKIFENRAAWSFYVNYYRDKPLILVVSILLTIGQAALFIPLAMIMREILNVHIENGDQDAMIKSGIMVFGLLLGTSVLRLVNKYIIVGHNKKLHNKLRDDLFRMLYDVPKSFYTKLENMRWHTIFVHDIVVLDNMSVRMLTTFLPSIVICTALGLVMLYINWILFAITIVVAPLVVITVLITTKRIKKVVVERRQAIRTYSSQINFALNMMDLTRIQVAEDVEISKQEEHNAYLRALDFKTSWLNELFTTIQETLLMMMTLVLLVGGGIAAIQDAISLGDLFTFYVVFMFNRKYLMQLFGFVPVLINGSEALDRLHEIVGVDEERPYYGDKQPIGKADIKVEKVSFSYGEEPLLKEISLEIPQGEFVALQGDNGSGKTTLLYIILGFYRPKEGEVFYGGIPHSELDIKAMRREFGVVLQESPIFRGTIRENIIYGREDVMTQEAFEQACDISGATRFVNTLANGFDTEVGDNGLMLSGGQRQRIAIARALLTKPKILVLDEPTNHLDKDAVASLLSHLEVLPYKPTIIMISHIDEFVRRTDRIIRVTDNGVQVSNPKVAASTS